MKPLNYKLVLTPDFKKFVFDGEEVLTFELTESLNEIQLDCEDITIKTIKLLIDSENIIKSFNIDKEKNILHIHLTKSLGPETYQIDITYQGIINAELKGFYRSKYSYKDKDDYVITTQFEPDDAHRAFPCVDKPSYKATFDISFIIPENYTGISNMLPVEEKKYEKSLKIVRFATTPIMSTYLLYFGIGKWEILERKTNKKILYRGITTPGKSQYMQFALEVAEKCLDYFSEYFDYPYPLPKLDLLAIPDFASGAMENWGAVTFREIMLLCYPEKTSESIRERIAEVICHELAHQWFGNLVTMQWFDDIWLNESFATYMAFKALHQIFPEWNNWQNYVRDTVFEGMALDSLHSTHPIHMKVQNVDEIEELFDEISYDKGGSVLRMIEGYLGGENFKRALRIYVRKFQYKNTVARDLWDRFEEVSGDLTSEMIEKFIMQPGFPLIDISVKQYGLHIEQERFLYIDKDKENTTWDIPIVMQLKNNQQKKLIVTDKQQVIQQLNKNDLVMFNRNYSGFYITNYDQHLSEQIGKSISLNNPQERVGILHDLYQSVLADKQSLDSFLDFINTYFLNEEHPYVVQYVAGKLLRIFKLTNKQQARKMLSVIARDIVKRYGLTPKPQEKLDITTARNTSLSALVILEDKKICQFAEQSFEESLIDEGSLHKDLKGVVYSSVVWIDDKYYPIVLDLYGKREVQEDRMKLLSALGNSRNPKLIEKTLQFILTDKVRLSDFYYPVVSASLNPHAKEVVYDWLIKDWNAIQKKLGLVKVMYTRRTLKFIVPECAIGKEEEIKKFLNERKISGLEKTYAQVLEELKVSARFVGKYRK